MPYTGRVLHVSKGSYMPADPSLRPTHPAASSHRMALPAFAVPISQVRCLAARQGVQHRPHPAGDTLTPCLLPAHVPAGLGERHSAPSGETNRTQGERVYPRATQASVTHRTDHHPHKRQRVKPAHENRDSDYKASIGWRGLSPQSVPSRKSAPRPETSADFPGRERSLLCAKTLMLTRLPVQRSVRACMRGSPQPCGDSERLRHATVRPPRAGPQNQKEE